MYAVPHFRYGALIWELKNNGRKKEFIRLYNHSFKAMMNLPKRTPNKYVEEL